MTKSLRLKAILCVIIIGGCLWFLWPTYRYATMPAAERERLKAENPEKLDKLEKKSLKLGLDLKGGMHLVLEIDDSQLKADEKRDALDRVLEIIRNRVDQFGVSEPTIQKEGTKRVIVQLPGLQDPERGKRLIGQTAMLEWNLVRQQGEVAAVLRKLDDVFKAEASGSLVEVNPAQAESLGVVPDTAKAAAKKGETPLTPEPFKSDVADSLLRKPGEPEMPLNVPLQTMNMDMPFSSLLASFYRDWVLVTEQNVPRVRRMLATPEAQKAIPKDSEFMWFDEWMPLQDGTKAKPLFLVAKDIHVSGSNLVNANPNPNPQNPTQMEVQFQFNRKGARELARFTGENVGRFTAIILDGKIKSFPIIKSKIPDGRGVIEGTFSDVEARDLSIVLRAGALPTSIFVVEERTVGPSLGADSIRMGIKAGIFGILVVFIFMAIYYRLAGVIATVGLFVNIILLMGLLAYFGAALTLPGIAGILLTIGMSVDANVLVFERIREELRRAKTVRSAVDAGYERAFITILDSNLTTVISAVALWQFGTGPLKGFATTLTIGIAASMFAALVFCRMIFDLWVGAGRLEKLSI